LFSRAEARNRPPGACALVDVRDHAPYMKREQNSKPFEAGDSGTIRSSAVPFLSAGGETAAAA
jgi:hypothetical protein